MYKETFYYKTIKFILISIFLFISCFAFYFEFSCIQKHFPNMTICEYLFLQDKIRIIPNGND